MHQDEKKALEMIDASIFSGDVLFTDFDEIKYFVTRWSQAVNEHVPLEIQKCKFKYSDTECECGDDASEKILLDGEIVPICERHLEVMEARADKGVEYVIGGGYYIPRYI